MTATEYVARCIVSAFVIVGVWVLIVAGVVGALPWS